MEFQGLLSKIENKKDENITLYPDKLKQVMNNLVEKYQCNHQEGAN